jgi:hypothetical protein
LPPQFDGNVNLTATATAYSTSLPLANGTAVGGSPQRASPAIPWFRLLGMIDR